MARITQTQKTRHDKWVLGGNPRAIERQEAEGQKQLVESSQLPTRINSPSSCLDARDCYEKMGIRVHPFSDKVARIFKDQVKKISDDPLFLTVILPDGWKLEAINHSMWNHLLDEHGRIRATIFYKAAFYDRDAFANLISRYQFTTEFVTLEPGSKNYDQYAIVKDNATSKRLFQSGSYPTYDKGAEFRQQAKDFLAKNFPDHEDFTAYW